MSGTSLTMILCDGVKSLLSNWWRLNRQIDQFGKINCMAQYGNSTTVSAFLIQIPRNLHGCVPFNLLPLSNYSSVCLYVQRPCHLVNLFHCLILHAQWAGFLSHLW